MNLALCPKNSDEIIYFVKNAIKKGNSIFGDNIKLSGIKEKTWDFIWTDDNIEEIKKDDKIYYAIGRSHLNEKKEKEEVNPISKTDIKNLMDVIKSNKPLTVEETDFLLKCLGQFLLNGLELNKYSS